MEYRGLEDVCNHCFQNNLLEDAVDTYHLRADWPGVSSRVHSGGRSGLLIERSALETRPPRMDI